MKNTDADFVVFVLLNRGNRLRSREGGKKAPEVFVFPMSTALAARNNNGWNKVMTKKIEDREKYRENWELIQEFLSQPGESRP